LIAGFADTYREKPELLARRAVFGLDDFVTCDDSSKPRIFGGKGPALITGSAHINDRPSKREGCGIAAALFVGHACGWEAVSRRRKTLYGARSASDGE
jgi:hypothetical protein